MLLFFSGNVIFEIRITDDKKLGAKIEKAIEKELGLHRRFQLLLHLKTEL